MRTKQIEDNNMTPNSISEKVGDFERRIAFTRAFDKRDPEPSKNYGIGGVHIFFHLIGEKGAVTWQIGTDWYPRSVQRTINELPSISLDRTQPSAWDLGYHSKKAHYEGQHSVDDCDVLNGICYYDGSTLNAERYIDTFLEQGPDAIWKMLEEYYKEIYCED